MQTLLQKWSSVFACLLLPVSKGSQLAEVFEMM